MRISSALFTRGLAVLLLALALNMAAAAFMGGDTAQATSSVNSPQETPTVTLPPLPTATNTKAPPTSPPPTSPPNQPTNTPVPPATPTPTPTKIVVLPQTGVPDGGSSANLALIAAALATAGAGLFVASRRTTR